MFSFVVSILTGALLVGLSRYLCPFADATYSLYVHAALLVPSSPHSLVSIDKHHCNSCELYHPRPSLCVLNWNPVVNDLYSFEKRLDNSHLFVVHFTLSKETCLYFYALRCSVFIRAGIFNRLSVDHKYFVIYITILS